MTSTEKQERLRLKAEQIVLSAILSGIDENSAIIDQLEPEYFQQEPHRLIFQATKDLRIRDEGIDVISVADELLKNGALELSGGRLYLMDLAMYTSGQIKAHLYIELLKAGKSS